MKILVTGANGLVGKELTKKLKSKKHTIIEFNKSNGKNILNEKTLQKEMKSVEVVIHLAGLLNGNDDEVWQTNVIGTKNVINCAIKNKVKKFIFLSSTGVYGSLNQMITETTSKKPENIYEKSKAEAENIILNYQEEINVNILRSAMILGPNKYWENMFKLLKKNFPLPCSGKNSFQIIYVKDLVNAIILLLEKGKSGEVYLISGKEKWTLKKFCEIAKSQINKNKNNKIYSIPASIAIFFGKILNIKILNENNIRHICKERNYSIKKIEKLGFKQKYNLKDAIKKTIKELG
jgi:nucleoside-diphosphate-sugar epimerase